MWADWAGEALSDWMSFLAELGTDSWSASIEAGFPLTYPDWGFNITKDKGRLSVYHQSLLAGLEVGA